MIISLLDRFIFSNFKVTIRPRLPSSTNQRTHFLISQHQTHPPKLTLHLPPLPILYYTLPAQYITRAQCAITIRAPIIPSRPSHIYISLSRARRVNAGRAYRIQGSSVFSLAPLSLYKCIHIDGPITRYHCYYYNTHSAQIICKAQRPGCVSLAIASALSPRRITTRGIHRPLRVNDRAHTYRVFLVELMRLYV